MATLQEITKAVRELSFDRFLVPTLHVKSTEEVLKVTPTGISLGTTEISTWADSPTLEDTVDDLIAAGLVIATDGYFVGTESSAGLRPGQTMAITEVERTFMRRSFFSDTTVREILRDYYERVLYLRILEPSVAFPTPLESSLEEMDPRTLPHLVLWVAYHMVERRRLYETANAMLGQTNWSDGSGAFTSGAQPGASTTVSVGSVFTMTEDNTSGFIDADFDRVGSRNTLGDAQSFWFRLQVDLRQRIETQCNDFSLRPNEVMMGKIELDRPLNYHAYFDTYPYTLSPLSRGILSGGF